MTYNISCVLLIPAAHRDAVNALAESLGYGPNNLSVELVHADGGIWYGCHTWCAQSFLDQLADPAYSGSAMAALVVSAVPDGDSASNWAEALAEHELSPAT
jgi:hypothetical protein